MRTEPDYLTGRGCWGPVSENDVPGSPDPAFQRVMNPPELEDDPPVEAVAAQGEVLDDGE